METTIKVLKKISPKKPIFIEGLPGLGNVGRVSAGYLVDQLKMEKIAELYSPHFLPLVILHNTSVAHMLKCEFYYYKGKRDIILLTGDTQSISPEGHYEVCEKVLDFVEKMGVKEIITLGGFAHEGEIQEPRVIGSVNDKKLLKKYNKYDIDFTVGHPIGTIVGASGLLLGMGRMRNIDALCLMGETIGLPLITDPRASEKILQVLSKIIGINIDLTKLENAISEMEEGIKKTEDIHRKMLKELPRSKEDIKYIG